MDIKNFKILTLGTSGAGKTVFLASMFKQLFSQSDAQFNLKVENAAQRKQLNAIYTQLINGEKWPEGTRGYSEWTFTCRVQTEDLSNFTACQFTYFDYAGGRLAEAEYELEFLTMLEQADAILGLLDGHKIYNWLMDQNSSQVTDFLQKDLAKILDCMQHCNVPIQFIISKWDLLEPQFSLEAVRDRLLTIPAFKQVVQARNKAGASVRLIPVSAVGTGFAKLENGIVQRIPGAIPMPELVEVPIACVLPDQLRFQLEKNAKKQQELGKPNNIIAGAAGGVLSFLGAGLGLASDLVGIFADDPILYMFAGGVAGLSSRLGRSIQQNTQERAVQLEASLQQVKDEKTALTHAIQSFLNIQQELLEAYPESDLILPSLIQH